MSVLRTPRVGARPRPESVAVEAVRAAVAVVEDPELHRIWLETIATCQRAYRELADGLAAKFAAIEDRTLRRKKAREAARSVLPTARCPTRTPGSSPLSSSNSPTR